MRGYGYKGLTDVCYLGIVHDGGNDTPKALALLRIILTSLLVLNLHISAISLWCFTYWFSKSATLAGVAAQAIGAAVGAANCASKSAIRAWAAHNSGEGPAGAANCAAKSAILALCFPYWFSKSAILAICFPYWFSKSAIRPAHGDPGLMQTLFYVLMSAWTMPGKTNAVIVMKSKIFIFFNIRVLLSN